jgi:fumarate hydratase subunit beta
MICITTPLTDRVCRTLKAGDLVLLSGEVYTARDVAHRRLYEAIGKGQKLPIDIKGKIILYAAPTPARPGRIIGSIGPTTGSRMDAFTPALLRRGLKGMIGKGKRSPEVIEAIRKYGAVYFGAPGGVAALLARHVVRAETAAYGDLGPESILRLEVSEMPLVVLTDTRGKNLYEMVR